MTKKWFVILIVVALITALIPVSVFAGAPAELKVFVRNTTGAEVDLRLTDADGNFHWATLPAGVTELALTEGKYEYYAVTVCGTQVGQWNLNVSKQLDIHCKDGMLEFNLAKRCDNDWWGTVYFAYDYVNHFPGPIGVFYSEHDSVNVDDNLIGGLLPPWATIVKGETMCWGALGEIYPYHNKIGLGLWEVGKIF